MCLFCADECVKEGLGVCPECCDKLLLWSNEWRRRWHDAALTQHKIMNSLSKEIRELNGILEHVREVDKMQAKEEWEREKAQ